MIATQTMPFCHEDLVAQYGASQPTQQTEPLLDTERSAKSLTVIDSASDKFYSYALIGGNSTMLVAVIGLLLCILVGYSYADSFSLWAQVASHIGLILFATAVKIGYVMRCVGLDGMGHLQL